MIEAQASVMGFRESFLLVAVGFFAALVPAYFMRPWRPSQESGRKGATERTGPSPPREAGSTAF